MAHKKGVGSSKNGRESQSKRLGVKIFGGQEAIAGNVIIRQRGTAYHPGKNVGIGKDHTIFALIDGTVVFTTKKQDRRYVYVRPKGEAAAEPIVTTRRKAIPVEEPVMETSTMVAEESNMETPSMASEDTTAEASAMPSEEPTAETSSNSSEEPAAEPSVETPEEPTAETSSNSPEESSAEPSVETPEEPQA